ncbi:cell wall hydrolase [Aureimonas fodinaquatilis]|nr:cell wall hydrolase [Aureimonas fodinaquatilis]
MHASLKPSGKAKSQRRHSRHALRGHWLVAGGFAIAAVLGTGNPVAKSERAELELELAAQLLQQAVQLEIEELASLRTTSPLAERGDRVLSAYTQLKMFSTGTVLSVQPQTAAERAPGDGLMLTALSGLPAEAEAAELVFSSFERPHPLRDTVETVMANVADEPAATPSKPDGASMEMAYAPTSTPRLPSRFDDILTGRDDGFVPPLGENDHAWAAKILPESAYSTAEQTCLATGIYFEARGESETGQAAVAQVILNRVRNPTYPDTICGVVYQNRHMRNRCQFSFACDGIPDRITNQRAYDRAKAIGQKVTAGQIWLPEVGSATHYHATYVRPRWARAMEKVEKIGLHVFYRTFNGGWN